MQKLLTSIALLSSGFISACSNTPMFSNNTSATATLPFSAEQAYALDTTHWLSVHPESGIRINSGQTEQAVINTPAEYLSTRSDQSGKRFISLDTSENRLISYRIIKGTFSDIRFGSTLPYPVEGLCLYQPSATELNVFLLDEQQMAHQLLLTDTAEKLEQAEIRQFPLPPNSEYCVVDDTTEQLFVSEENVGVWAYNARAESEVARSVVDLVAPHGKLQKNAGPLAVSQGHLLIAELGSHTLHSYQIQASGVTGEKTHPLAAHIQADSLMASTLNGQTLLGILDDQTGTMISAQLTLPELNQTDTHIAQVVASAETTPVKDRGDAADDPAVWVHPTTAENSLILGTNKKRGLYVYDLSGQQRQELEVGRINNVDVRQGFTYKGKPSDIAAASQRDRHAISLFRINPVSGRVTAVNEIKTTLDDVYGLCMYRNLSGQFHVFINDKDGRFEQYRISDSQQGWQGKKVREFSVQSQPEGCAADDLKQRLFIGEEDAAVWTLGAEASDSTELVKVAGISDILVDDIEGIDIYRRDGKAFLVVSSQGNDSYVLFNAEAPYDYIDRFRIGINASASIDGASETDGLAVSASALGDQYPEGILVVQDGRNLLPDTTQNFKLVDWRAVRALNSQL